MKLPSKRDKHNQKYHFVTINFFSDGLTMCAQLFCAVQYLYLPVDCRPARPDLKSDVVGEDRVPNCILVLLAALS